MVISKFEINGHLRDRPFNLKGGLCFFVSFRKIFSDNTRVRILFFLSRKAQNFFPQFNIRLYDKNSELDFVFFLHQNQNIFFSNIGNPNIFLEKKHTPPPFKLNGPSLSTNFLYLYYMQSLQF
jgi:hypothetical protein